VVRALGFIVCIDREIFLRGLAIHQYELVTHHEGAVVGPAASDGAGGVTGLGVRRVIEMAVRLPNAFPTAELGGALLGRAGCAKQGHKEQWFHGLAL
jgi:hypothetical protein